MNIQKMTLRINKARVFAYHGVLEQERKTGANFYVSLEADTDFSSSLFSDELADTVSYAALFDIIRQEMAIPSRLIEHVGGRILKHIFQSYPEIKAVRIEIIKENPPMGADCEGAGITMEATRETNL